MDARDFGVSGRDGLDVEDATGAVGPAAGADTFGAGPSGPVTGAEAAGCGATSDSAGGPGSVAAGAGAPEVTGGSPVTTRDPRLSCAHAASKMIIAIAPTCGLCIARPQARTGYCSPGLGDFEANHRRLTRGRFCEQDRESLPPPFGWSPWN